LSGRLRAPRAEDHAPAARPSSGAGARAKSAPAMAMQQPIVTVLVVTQARRERSRTPVCGLKALGGFLALAKSAKAQPEEPDDTSVVPLVCTIIFACIGVLWVILTIALRMRQWWRRRRSSTSMAEPPSASPSSSKVPSSSPYPPMGHEGGWPGAPSTGGALPPIYMPSKLPSQSEASSSSTNHIIKPIDTSRVLRRGQSSHAVWARAEEQKLHALGSNCTTCGSPIEEPLAASCANCHRRMHCSSKCGTVCGCPHTLCLYCFGKHKCLNMVRGP
jgi:hypothetical protein